MNKIADVAMGIVIVAGTYVATRPGSQGPKFVTAIGGAFEGALRAGTGQRK